MEKECNAYFDGFLAGFMCCRKPHDGGRHMWFPKGQGNRKGWYWTNETNSWRLKYSKKRKVVGA